MPIEPDLAPLAMLQTGSARRRHGAHALLWAVLLDGIEAYCRGVLSGATCGLEYREAERWIFTQGSTGLTGFPNLCDVFGLDSRGLRRGLLHFREHPRPEVIVFLQRDAA